MSYSAHTAHAAAAAGQARLGRLKREAATKKSNVAGLKADMRKRGVGQQPPFYFNRDAFVMNKSEEPRGPIHDRLKMDVVYNSHRGSDYGSHKRANPRANPIHRPTEGNPYGSGPGVTEAREASNKRIRTGISKPAAQTHFRSAHKRNMAATHSAVKALPGGPQYKAAKRRFEQASGQANKRVKR